MKLICGHIGPLIQWAHFLWCDTCRQWVRVRQEAA